MRFLVILAIASCCLGCSRAGKWEDDPENFKRAWGHAPPPDVRVLRSWYWRSSHFTREEAYYFHFAPHAALAQSFVRDNQMRQMRTVPSFPDDEACFDRPPWFASKSLDAYDIWVCAGTQQCVVLIDRTTQDVFLAACQL